MTDTQEAATPPPQIPRLTGIIWGGPKSGKTTYAASSPGHKWVINLDIEGWTSLLHRNDYTLNDLSDKTSEELVAYFKDGACAKWIREQNIQPGDTIIMDSMTVLNQAGVEVAVKKGIGAGQRSGWVPTIEEPGMSAYGARGQYLYGAMGTVNREARRKKAHVWFICHEDTPERNDKGDFMYQSMLLSDKAVNNATGAVSEIWRMQESDNNRTVMIRSTGRYKPMGTRMFKAEDKKEFKLIYDIDKPDLEQPMSIASLWKQFEASGYRKINVPEPPAGRR